ncbi:SIR2 family NAD-dependent protein deacylase [Streptosporangium sp. NPDC087985]|uniref:SIR2 family NAD-dependent protein deacylase n=1 Tax=Streptosporangium sp. NPDC087985 TaxID=3366196 RepID=UPI0037F7A741
MDDADWRRLIDQLRSGDCTPFLGAGACYGTLPTGSELSRNWANIYKYPFPDDHDLARVMQYAAVQERDPVYLKRQICDHLRSRGLPDFNHADEPHALLAKFKLRVFLTTNYDNFLVEALRGEGKTANTAVCSWADRTPQETPELPEPSVDEPLVYHLHGNWAEPSSLVLTEDDYLEYLANVAAAQSSGNRTLIPIPVLHAMTTSSLLFMGYSLQDWTFRVLFHGLLRTIPDVNRRRHVSVQLVPPVNTPIAEAEERAKQYLAHYLGERLRILIFWGTAAQFCEELRLRLGPGS